MTHTTKSNLRTAHQWSENGDHPEDQCTLHQGIYGTGDKFLSEGKVVNRFRACTDDELDFLCQHCDTLMHNHGWIDSGGAGRTVCPGDFILTSDTGEYFPVKPDVVAAFLREDTPEAGWEGPCAAPLETPSSPSDVYG